MGECVGVLVSRCVDRWVGGWLGARVCGCVGACPPAGAPVSGLFSNSPREQSTLWVRRLLLDMVFALREVAAPRYEFRSLPGSAPDACKVGGDWRLQSLNHMHRRGHFRSLESFVSVQGHTCAL